MFAVRLHVSATAALAAAALSVVVGGSAVASADAAHPAGHPGSPYHVRVLVLTMFSGETLPWLEHQSLPVTVHVRGAYGPLRCSTDGLCVTTLGEGKSNAGPSVTAIVTDDQLSFSHAYFMTAGIAGTSPSAGTLGFGAWARYVVDWDLGHHLIPRTAPGLPFDISRSTRPATPRSSA
jgi:purine nucleoside permease